MRSEPSAAVFSLMPKSAAIWLTGFSILKKIKVVNSGKEIKAQTKTFTAVAVCIGNNAKPLDPSYHLFVYYALA
jgi:hypothetical protein